jgi:hypothetical protein
VTTVEEMAACSVCNFSPSEKFKWYTFQAKKFTVVTQLWGYAHSKHDSNQETSPETQKTQPPYQWLVSLQPKRLT